MKWESLLQKSLAIGADYIATGHYARIKKLPNGRYTICRSGSARKDQTYALYNLTQNQLAHTLFPIGEYEKERIREIAKEADLMVAHKPDSQEICFVPDGDYASFIEQETGKKEITNSVKMTNYQFATFKAMANNTNEGTGKLTFSKADMDSAMNKFSKGGFVKDISEFLAKGYKILNPKKFTEENKLSVYVSSGKEKTSGVMSFQAADKVSSTSKTQ